MSASTALSCQGKINKKCKSKQNPCGEILNTVLHGFQWDAPEKAKVRCCSHLWPSAIKTKSCSSLILNIKHKASTVIFRDTLPYLTPHTSLLLPWCACTHTHTTDGRRACRRGAIGSTMGAYPRDTGLNTVEGNGHFFPSYRQLYLSSFSDTHTHTHTHTHTKKQHYCTYLWSEKDGIVDRQHCRDAQNLLTAVVPKKKQKKKKQENHTKVTYLNNRKPTRRNKNNHRMTLKIVNYDSMKEDNDFPRWERRISWLTVLMQAAFWRASDQQGTLPFDDQAGKDKETNIDINEEFVVWGRRRERDTMKKFKTVCYERFFRKK